MSSKVRFGILMLFLTAAISLGSASNDLSVERLLELANKDRAVHGLPQLKLNPVLNLAASAKAYDMVENNYFSHERPDGTHPWIFLRSLGYDYVHAGENLAVNFNDAEELERSWMSSPKHRANILSPYYSEVGLAVVKNNRSTVIVQFFGNRDHILTYSK
jgi:uncharacterized protein YkwD